MAARLSVRSLSMRSSLLAVAIVGLLVTATVGAVGVLRMNAIADRAESLYGQSLVPLSTVKDIQQLIWHSRWASLSNLTATDPAKAADYATETSAVLDLVAQQLEAYDQLEVTAGERAAMDDFEESWAAYLTLRTESSALKNAGRIAEWQNFRSTRLNPAIADATTKLDTLKDLSQKQAAAKVADAQSTAQRARVVLGLALLVGVLLAGGFALFIAAVFNRRVRALSEVLAAMADGDLTEREPDSADNEIGEMSRSVHRAATQMRAAVRTLARSSAGLAERSVQLQQASRDLATGTDQTSDRVEGIGSAAEQVSAGVQAVAGGAREMGAAIREISVSANEAALVADNAVDAANKAEQLMLTLDSSSGEIDSVVKTITAIAEQTNLLALNATIEAARAGETGKGFAVVAGEVKDLAQETAKATVEISRRTEAIQADTRLAVESITGIGQIVSKINDYQSTIASAVEQQSATTDGMTSDLGRTAGGASQISDQLAQVSQVTATTRGSAQATQAAADELTRISDELNHTVAAFRY